LVLRKYSIKDFEDETLSEVTKKKLIELLYFLPVINNYLLTKLSILIINQKVSTVLINQILGIIKIKYVSRDGE
jgi:hypothetical protein